MAKTRDPSNELLDALADVHMANSAALLALAKTLEEAGAMKVEDYERMLRSTSESLARRGAVGPASFVDDLADIMKRDVVKKQ
jgi:hypothetical protein